MKLRYILGMPGSGKSTLCTDEIVKAAASGRHALYIVPEQFSLESERLLTSKSKNNVLLGSEVLSFVHLAHRLLSETGGSAEKILDDNSKALLLRKITNELVKNGELKFYGKSASRQGFIDNISALITEFIRYSVSPEILDDKADKLIDTDRGLADKLHDISLIYSNFNKNLNERYIAKDALLDVLAARIPVSHMFRDTDIWIDSFTDFTAQEFKVIEALIQVCDSVTIALTIHSSALQSSEELNAFDPYFEAKRSIKTINEFASSIGIKPQIITLNEDKRHLSSPDLCFLSKKYFSGAKYHNDCNNIKISSAASVEAELSYMCGEILSLVRKNNYRYSDIAVMISSDKYYMPLKSIFARNKIPYFTDIRRDILSHPMTELVKSIFAVIISNNSVREVFHLLRTGFNDFEADEISYIENYCIACGIRGNKWFEEWTSTLSGRYTEDDLNNLNDMRSYIAEILSKIRSFSRYKKYTVSDMSKFVYELTEYLEVADKLNELISEAQSVSDENAVRLHTQIWDIIWGIFNRMCEIMGNDEMTPAEFYKLIDTGIQNITMGLIPPTYDSITVAEFNRSRLPNIKALFMLGVNEGIIPPYHDDTNLLSDNDRFILAMEGCELGGDNLRLINRDRYNIYSYITKPSEKLYLSYNADLESGIPSSLIHDLKSIFNLTVEETGNKTESTNGIYSQEQAFELFIKYLSGLKSPDDTLSPLYESVYKHLVNNGYGERIEHVKNWLVFNDPTMEHIPAELASALFTDDKKEMISGITSIEDYYKCPYMYFLKHGLKAYDRKEYDLDFSDYGSFLHNVLKLFSEKLLEDNVSWDNIDEQYLLETVTEIVNSSAAGYRSDFFRANKTNEYISHRLVNIAVSTIKAFSDNHSGFIPCGYEINFGKGTNRPLIFDLGKNSRLVLTGSIDRVDSFKDPQTGETYIKITDYKTNSGSNDIFSSEKMLLGIQLQLPLYMEAYMADKKEVKPGGFFYFKIDNPILRVEDKSVYNKLISGGIAVDNPTVLNALAKDDADKLNLAKEKSFIKISENEFTSLIDDINKKITDAGSNIIKGEIKATPFITSDQSTPCSYCEYKAVCCFELCTGKDKKYRRLKNDTDQM